jgi:hypothetical protein
MRDGVFLDAETLLIEAKASGHGESYRAFATRKGVRASVGARVKGNRGELFVEVLVQLCRGGSAVDLSSLEEALSLLKDLQGRGYAMTCSEGTVMCELEVEAGELAAEVNHLMKDPRKPE